MKRLLVKSTLYILPFLPVLGFPFAVLFTAGELTSADQVVAIQQRRPILYGVAYSQPDKHFKLRVTIGKQVDVLALGNSRVSQFRGAFFRDGVSFYNASMAVSTVADFRHFVESIPADRQPRVIIVGLDHWFFNENFKDYDHTKMPERYEEREDRSEIFEHNWRSVWSDYLTGRYSWSMLERSNVTIGLNAKVKNLGFRNDGSIRYGYIIANPDNPDLEDFQFRQTLRHMRSGKYGQWVYGKNVSGDAVAELGRFLQECDARGIQIIGFLPIFPHAIYEKMRTMPEEYGYVFALKDKLQPLFAKHAFEFYDFSDLSDLGASDAEALDGNHTSEKSHVRLLLHMIDQGSIIARYADKAHLQLLLDEASGSNLQVFKSEIWAHAGI